MCRLHQIPKQPAHGKESVRALGAKQWETFLDMRTTDEQTCPAHNHKRSTTGRFGGSAQSSDLDIGRDDDDDDPPSVTGVDSVGDVETAGGACSVTGSANLTFYMTGSETEG